MKEINYFAAGIMVGGTMGIFVMALLQKNCMDNRPTNKAEEEQT